MKKKTNFIKMIQWWGILILITIGGCIVALDIVTSCHDFNSRSDQMRADYISRQKQIIRNEVDRVVAMINHEKAKSEALTRSKIKSRVYEAYSIAQNIYQQNKTSETRPKIQKMILDALRPIRFENGSGYYFATRLDGLQILFSDKPEMEGLNLLNFQDAQGQYVIKDMIEIARQPGEGFYEYYWTKPDAAGNDFKKISFIKRFKPFDWFIGTGLYVKDVEDDINSDLLSAISRMRFGKEGYIFVNRFNGDALVSNGKIISGVKKLWEVFNANPEKTKKIFDMEMNAALKPEGDYIYYSLIKLTAPDKEAPKVSFIYGIPDLQWLVGAGVYLDDVDADIAVMHMKLNNHIKKKVTYSILIVVGITALFLFLFNLIIHRFRKDVNLVISFFNRAATSDEKIDRDRVQFNEFDRMAKHANKMLQNSLHDRHALLDERERLFVTLRSIGDGVMTTDKSGSIEFMNQTAEQLTGWRIEEAEGKHLTDVFHIVNSQTNDKVENPVDKVLENGKIAGLANHTMLISRNGTKYQIADSAAPIKDHEGKIRGVVLVFRDVTKQYRIREALRQSEERFRQVYEHMAVGVARVSIDFHIENANEAYCRILGYSEEELIGKHLRDITHPETLEENLRLQSQLAMGEIDHYRMEKRFLHKDGSVVHGILDANVVRDTKGKPCYFLGSVLDITQQKKAEQELQKMEKLKSVGTLAGGIAHDFNNIMMGLFGNISLARAKLSKDSPAVKFLKEAEKSMNRAIRLTKQLLTFAKGGAPVKEDVGIGALVEEVVLFDLSGSHVKPVFNTAKELWKAQVDKGQIQQVLSNLTINARQAMPDGGHLRITLENADEPAELPPGLRPGKYIRVVMQDEGTGIDPKHLDRIFDPYFSTKQTGSGLGLATVFSIIQKHGGHITVDSQLGKGATFTLYLPASESRQFHEAKPPASTAPVAEQKAEILVMDDEETVLSVTRQMLEKYGFSAQGATDGKQAIAMYKQSMEAGEPFSLVIMDLTIPGGTGGKEAIKELIAIDPGAKAIVSSGYATDPVMADYGDYGFKGRLMKPFNMKALIEEVTRVIEIT